MGESDFAPLPTALYGMVMLAASLAWFRLTRVLIAANGGSDSALARAVGWDTKTLVCSLLDVVAIPLALVGHVLPALGCYVVVAMIWLVPDRRIERASA
jgi:TMEM175 potassium channel family protein